MNWAKVCLDKKRGGLGIRNLDGLKKVFLGKWGWRFVVKRDSLWRHVIVGKFGEKGGS